MALRALITVTTVLCLLLGLLCPTPVASFHLSRSCCTSYNRKPVPFQRIKGYVEQTTKDYCRIPAIIFYTVKKNMICATPEDEWVRNALQLLSSRLKRMSETGSSAGGRKNTGKPSTNDGSGSFSTQIFANSTESLDQSRDTTETN